MKIFLKQKLLENKAGIYSLIAHHYADRINEMGCSLFKDWLSQELSIDKSTINLSSLYSASKREQKKEKRKSKTNGFQPVFMTKQNSINPGSNFSDPNDIPTSKDHITEM